MSAVIVPNVFSSRLPLEGMLPAAQSDCLSSAGPALHVKALHLRTSFATQAPPPPTPSRNIECPPTRHSPLSPQYKPARRKSLYSKVRFDLWRASSTGHAVSPEKKGFGGEGGCRGSQPLYISCASFVNDVFNYAPPLETDEYIVQIRVSDWVWFTVPGEFFAAQK